MIQKMFATVDIKKTNYKNVGKINHGDDLLLEIRVLSDGNTLSFNNPMVDLLVKKSDGKMVRQTSGIELIKPNIFVIEVSKDCVTSPGLTTNQLIINDDGRVSTCMFYYTVLNSLEEDVMPSISNVEVLEQLDEFVVQIQDKMELFDSDLAERMDELTDSIVELEKNFNDTSSTLNEAEVKRSEAEQLRVQAEVLRVQNEDKRAESENVRVQNESDRAAAELIREQREVERVLNDEERHQNESERAMNEELRQRNESVRQSNESIRMSNETDRKTQENRRATAETNRVNAETTRRNNENSRISNETERQKAMNEMKSLIGNVNDFNERVGVIENHTRGKINIYEYEHLVVNDDWTNAINRCINEFGKKCTIYFPSGTYKVSGTIEIDNVVIEGENSKHTIIQFANLEEKALFNSSASSPNFSIRTIKIVGERNNSIFYTGVLCYLNLYQCDIRNFKYVFETDKAGWCNKFIDCSFRDFDNLLLSSELLTDTKFIACFIVTGENLVTVGHGDVITFYQCVIENINKSMFSGYNSRLVLSNVTISGCYIENYCGLIDTDTPSFSDSNVTTIFGSNFVIENSRYYLKTSDVKKYIINIINNNSDFNFIARNNTFDCYKDEILFNSVGTNRFLFEHNNYFYQNVNKISNPFTDDFMKNKKLINIEITNNNVLNVSGSIAATHGIILGDKLVDELKNKVGYMYYHDYSSNLIYATKTGTAMLQPFSRGTSENRRVLTDANAGYIYFDTTLNKPIWWTGYKWVDANGSTV